VRITRDYAQYADAARRSTIGIVLIGVAGLVAGIVIAFGLAGSLVAPIRGLADTAHRLGEGDLTARAGDVGSTAEVKELGATFDEMADRLERTVQAQREFVANASHQLRTPLTGLRLRLEAAALKADDPDVERELVAAERETVRLARLLSELLTLARERERPEPEEVSLAEAAREAHDRWEGPAQTGGRRLLVRGEGEPLVAATDADLAVILDNLIENALNYSPLASTVAIEWGQREGSARLAVLDEGPGIDPAERERVFERFYRGEAGADAPGTGLGLSVVEALAERWDGSIGLRDRPSGGTEAEVLLPLLVRAPVVAS
jgi:two-component system, OmpR family, sensor kinase